LATNAGVDALPFVVQKRAAKRPFRPLAAGDLELFRRELFPPLGIGLGDGLDLDGAYQMSLFVENLGFHWFLFRARRASNGGKSIPLLARRAPCYFVIVM